jgi:crotonobetainyl-CoA:carnitine CoA-transferase CaiB-like acyl-CoA transferase
VCVSQTNEALHGIRVLDLSTSVAGFQAGQVLCDFGAEVVHVEPPGGSPLRTLPSYPFLARGRKSIVLDLKQAPDLTALGALALGADVLIETFRPGVMERFGLGYDELVASNPALVYTSITGWGRSGPYAGTKGYEALVMARLGAMWSSAGMVERPGPAHLSAPWASFGATQLALTGTLAALHERTTSGRGQRVDTSLVAGLAGQGPYNWFLRVIADRYPDAFNFTPPFSDAGVPNDGVFFMLLIALTKDGRWMQFAQVQPHLFRAFMRAVDLEWMYDDPTWKDVPRLATEQQRSEFWDILLGKVRERTFAEWQEVFDADHNVWAEIFRRDAELLDHPQIVHLGAVVELDDPHYGRVRQPGPLVLMEATPAQLDDRAAPSLDEHGASLRAEPWAHFLGRAVSEAPPSAGAGPLSGVTVLELGSFYAAPYGATVLADLGATVIKVEPLSGEPIRFLLPFPEAGAIKVLQGKRTIALDLDTDAGRAIVGDIARHADLVLMSYRAGVVERQGIDAATLRSINPDLVYLTCPGYGADGPCGDRPAYAPSIGAGSGLAMRNMGGVIPEHDRLTTAEVRASARKIFGSGTSEFAQADGISALSVATAMALGLLVRDRTGIAQPMLTSMLTSSAQMLCDDLTLYDGRPPTIAPDAELYGYGARYRLYETADGWVYLAAPGAHEWPGLVEAMAGIVDLTGLDTDDAALAAALTTGFLAQSAAAWERHMLAHDVGCVALAMVPPESVLLSDEFGRASGFVTDVVHPVIDEHPRLTPLVSLSRSGGVAGPGSTIGQHTDQILEWLGYDARCVADLRAAGVVGP